MAKKAVNPAPKQEQKSLEEALSKSEQFFENNKKTIFGCLIAIIVIIAGGMIYNAKVAQPRQEKASEAIFPGEAYFMNGDYSTALNGDAYGFEGFVELADQFKGTKANKLANLYAGLCYAQLDSMEIAQKYLAKFNGKDQMVAPAALGALANCYATNGEYDKAISTFEKAAKKADNKLLSPYYYMQAGIIVREPAVRLKFQTVCVPVPESKQENVRVILRPGAFFLLHPDIPDCLDDVPDHLRVFRFCLSTVDPHTVILKGRRHFRFRPQDRDILRALSPGRSRAAAQHAAEKQ